MGDLRPATEPITAIYLLVPGSLVPGTHLPLLPETTFH